MESEDCLLLDLAEEPNECKGIIFRGHVSQYFDGNKLVLKQELRILKRKSCPGCEKCGFLLDEINEGTHIIFPDEIKNGKLYSCKVTNMSRDYETGYVDGWDILIYEVKENGVERK